LHSAPATVGGRAAPGGRFAQLSFLVLAATYLYLNLFTFSNTPFLLEGDQNFFWAYGVRMLQGQLPYRDFFQFTTPGTDLVFLGLFTVFGPTIRVVDVAVILLGVALCWICLAITLRIMPRGWAWLTTALFLVCVYGWVLDATHHWFSLLAILCAVRVLMGQRTPASVACAGALLGLAGFFTQSAGAGAALAAFGTLAWEQRGGQQKWPSAVSPHFLLVISSALTWGALSAYFIAQVGWERLWYLWVVYPQRYLLTTDPLFRFEFTGLSIRKTLATLAFMGIHAVVLGLLVLMYPTALWHSRRKRQPAASADAMPLVLLALTGFVLFVESVSRPNWGRLYSVFLPALILFGWWIARSGGRSRRQVFVALWVVVVCFAAWQINSRQRHASAVVELPAGTAVIVDEDYFEQFTWLKQHTKPGDWFVQSYWLNGYFPLRLRSPLYLDAMWPRAETRPEYVDLAVSQLENQPPKLILWSPQQGEPNRCCLQDDHLGPFRAYLSSHYTRAHVFANGDEVWQLNGEAGERPRS
jgi:hypothetical protein